MVSVSEFDAADYLHTRAEMMGFLEDASNDPDPRVFAHAVETVNRALQKHGLTDNKTDSKSVLV